jgi:hypothetical protein
VEKLAEYRRHARECRTLAEQCGTLDVRKTMLKMADSWDAMAAALERKLGLGEAH